MKDTHPAILLANSRPSGRANKSIEALTDWAIDAEDMLRKLVEQNTALLVACKSAEWNSLDLPCFTIEKLQKAIALVEGDTNDCATTE